MTKIFIEMNRIGGEGGGKQSRERLEKKCVKSNDERYAGCSRKTGRKELLQEMT